LFLSVDEYGLIGTAFHHSMVEKMVERFAAGNTTPPLQQPEADCSLSISLYPSQARPGLRRAGMLVKKI
jgi:hypothetical protein